MTKFDPTAFDPSDFIADNIKVDLTPGDMIRLVREYNELTQSELEDITGITQSTISSLEAGTSNLGVERAKVLARALNVHPAVLLFPDWDSDAA